MEVNFNNLVKAFWCGADKAERLYFNRDGRASYEGNNLEVYNNIKSYTSFFWKSKKYVDGQHASVSIYFQEKELTLWRIETDPEKVAEIKTEIARRKKEYEENALNDLIC